VQAERKGINPRVGEALLPTHGQFGVPIVCCQQCDHHGDGSLSGQTVIRRSGAGQPYEDVAIWTLHDSVLRDYAHRLSAFALNRRARFVAKLIIESRTGCHVVAIFAEMLIGRESQVSVGL
jgi:hypothetical protein